MPLEDILKRIDEKASLLTDEILASAQSEAESKIKAAQDKAALLEARILEEARTRAAQIGSIAASRTDMQKKQMILGAKQEILSGVLEEAVRRLSNLPKEEYRLLLLDLISRKSQGTEEVILSEHDKNRLGPDFVTAANDRLTKGGKKGDLTISFSPEQLGGGFILRKGGVSDNVTFPAILNLTREDLEIELARVLFEKSPEKESMS
ncbi:MAG: V-type ATP synthase subunit E [Bacillota bacterium]|jgi:V/A-type H+-transporting ATPase subunit E